MHVDESRSNFITINEFAAIANCLVARSIDCAIVDLPAFRGSTNLAAAPANSGAALASNWKKCRLG
jgi:hypothetical protein